MCTGDGDWHATAHTWIARRHRDRWQVLLQLRSREKDVYPGCFDISSAGHVDAGDDYQETALRELWEELGIAAGPEDLEFLTLRWGQTDQEFSGKRVVDREIAAVYLYTRPVAAETLRLAAGRGGAGGMDGSGSTRAACPRAGSGILRADGRSGFAEKTLRP